MKTRTLFVISGVVFAGLALAGCDDADDRDEATPSPTPALAPPAAAGPGETPADAGNVLTPPPPTNPAVSPTPTTGDVPPAPGTTPATP